MVLDPELVEQMLAATRAAYAEATFQQVCIDYREVAELQAGAPRIIVPIDADFDYLAPMTRSWK